MEEKKIKVAFIYRFLLYYRIDLFERISANNGIDFTLIHGYDFPNSKFTNYKGKVNFRTKKLKTLKFSIEKRAKYLVFWPSLFFKLRGMKPEVLVIEGESNILNNIAVYMYCRLYRKNFIWWGVGEIPGWKTTLWQKLYKPLKKILLKRAKYIIAYSNFSKGYYSQFVDSEKVLVATNCLDNDKIDRAIEQYRTESAKLKSSMDLNNKFVIIYVGALIKRKRVDRLLKAYSIAKAIQPDCALIIIGGGVLEKELKEYVATHNLQDVHLTGKVFEGISKYFQMADLFVLPGLGGLSIFEAMVYGLPVISASADGTERDLIREGENGHILKTDSVEELSELLIKFIEDKEMSMSFGTASRKIIDNEINIKNKVNTFITAIENSLT